MALAGTVFGYNAPNQFLSILEHPVARTISEQLHAALKKIDRPGSFCVAGSVQAALPGLEVAGLGPIGLPLNAQQAKELKAVCEQAPYGKGEKTIVDTAVRRVWALDPDKFSLNNPEWQQFLKAAVGTVQKELGLEKQMLESHIYNLLLYEPGSFFLPHRDGEKLDRMVATMVVVLPSTFKGGELVVRHEGEERLIDFSSAEFNPFHTHFAAFYADCEHEVRALQSGHRLCLVYNLTLAKAKTGITAPRTADHIEEIAGILHQWSADEKTHKLVVTLGHQYTQDGLKWDALKGVDRVKARVLHEAATGADCQAYLALLTLWQTGQAEDDYEPRRRGRSRWSRHEEEEDEQEGEHEMGEIYDTSLTAEHWSDAEGKPLAFGPMKVVEEEIVPPESLTSVKPQEDYEGYTGNAGMTLARWYRHGAIVLWPAARHFDVLCDCGILAAITSLKGMVTKRQKDTATREQCVEFATKVLGLCTKNRCNEVEANDLLASLITIDDPELIRVFLRNVVAGKRVEPGKAIRPAFDKHGWATFQPELTAIFTETTAETLERNARFLEVLCTTTTKAAKATKPAKTAKTAKAAKPQSQENEEEWVKLCQSFAGLFVTGLDKLDETAAKGYEWQWRNVDRASLLAVLTRALLPIKQDELLGRVLRGALSDPKLYPLPTHIAALTILQPWLKTDLKTPSPAVAEWVTMCRRQLEALTAQEPKPPTDYRRDANINCKCADCGELRRFLSSPTEATYQFRAVQDRRSHLESSISQSNCDATCHTERRGSPHVLVCTKNIASFHVRLKKYHNDRKHLATILEIENSLR